MGFELLGLGSLTMTNLETGIEYDFGECTSLEVEQLEWSKDAEPSRVIKGFTNPAELSCETPMTIDTNAFNDLFGPSKFTCVWDTSITIQARWHKKARIRKKWLK